MPGLPDTLQRVVVTAEEEMQLARFAEDREHGAAQMAGWVLDTLEGAWVQVPQPAIVLVSVYFFGNCALLPSQDCSAKYTLCPKPCAFAPGLCGMGGVCEHNHVTADTYVVTSAL